VSQSSADVGSILSALITKVFYNLEITPNRFKFYLDKYISDPVNGIPQNRKDMSSARGNIIKEINKVAITWLIFTRALKIIKATRFTLTLTVHHSDLHTSNHSIEVDLGTSNTSASEEN
jgi:hypothetical protein